MAKLWWIVLVVLVTCIVGVKGGDVTPPSSNSDCSDLIYNMVDCVSFISEGSDERIPDGSCCSGFETVLSAQPECVCEALATSGSMGVQFDLAKATTLPAACGLSAPSLGNCGAIPPTPSASSPIPAETPEEAPAPSPLASMAYSSSASFSLISFAAASLSCILA